MPTGSDTYAVRNQSQKARIVRLDSSSGRPLLIDSGRDGLAGLEDDTRQASAGGNGFEFTIQQLL